jgi:hypothetical protein
MPAQLTRADPGYGVLALTDASGRARLGGRRQMDVAFYLEQAEIYLRMAIATEEPDVKADLLAFALENIEKARAAQG